MPGADRKLAEALKSFPSVIGSESFSVGASNSAKIQKVRPLELLSRSATALARYGANPDFGVMRRFPFSNGPDIDEPEYIQSLSEAGASLYRGNILEKPKPQDLINFYGPAGTISYLPLYEILEAAPLTLSQLKDKIIFVGSYSKVLSPALSPEDS